MKKRLPGFLALVAVTLPTILAVNARAADVEIKVLSSRSFVVSGGADSQAWHIQYGSAMEPGRLPASTVLSLAGPGSIAFFTHENWLRRIDAERGIVTGRWQFPGTRIAALSWKDDHHLHVEVDDYEFAGQKFRSGIDFDPDDPQMPFWPTRFSATTAELEAHCCRAAGFNNVSQANRWLDEAENTVRRDPLSPWLQIELAHIYRALGRPEAMNLFEQAVHIETADYSDLLRISPTLDDDGLPQLAREGFERGYASFWQRGMDPRLNASLLGLLLTYPNPRKISDTLRPELIDRRYQIGPWVESAAYAWDSYANILESSGRPQDAAQWRQRANEARENSLYMRNRRVMRWYEAAFALVPAVHLAAVLFIVCLFLRYLPERRLQARAQQTGLARAFSLFNLEYWSRWDRVAFFMICIASWLALGAAGTMTEALVHQASIPLSVGMGSFGGPATIWYFENRLADRPERDLLLAMAYQHEGQNGKAEQLYRKLNGFAESWNNLGVLFQDSGKTAEARHAYEEAVRLDPNMPDARWNLEHKPNDFWTGMHQKYISDRGMIAPPSREHFMTAFGVGSPVQFGLQALGGAFTGYAMLRANARFVIPRPFEAAFILTLVEIAIGFLLLFVLPYRDVTQPAYGSQKAIEYLLPGIAPQWRQWGGIVLVVWAAFLVQWIASLAGLGTAAFGGFPNIQRAFGVPSPDPPSNVFQLNAPYMVGGLVLLYAINAILLARSRRQV